jgi:hypothetical protein
MRPIDARDKCRSVYRVRPAELRQSITAEVVACSLRLLTDRSHDTDGTRRMLAVLHLGSKRMGTNDRNDEPGQGNGQQGADGMENARGGSTPNPHGGQPHLGRASNHAVQSAPGGAGETEAPGEANITAPDEHDELDVVDRTRAAGNNASRQRDRLDAIELADDRTEGLNPHRGTSATDPSGELGDVLSGHASNADYVSEAIRETPTLGAIDDDTDNM